ncbi:isocitrate lyase/PEP mutase family protein [Iodobacter fluviatilis]|uniref:2-methylisocitrate lyase-like PEP mutase family enzyme n=1 Tax=Iodobacter fluviatilis TaxID=537 RepID=A0A377Q6R7_9NEIS|nr:isocitrate lyase/phosphoenolpyruvate mutase family protein [Iodobacter fluviatilis]TCU89129.1 2-methylisocitrate lyase-like PEP mutase family enzyme [Iodobacter fluviatilis]STQ90497.1 Carboxyvinyl-carboxyphosphonate phosphorylmutase [Iodobacter fluviatilis]
MQLAQQFRQLNEQGQFLLANAWDAGSARVFAAAGFAAIGTTSGGIAYSRGLKDGEQIDPQVMISELAAICRSVNVPVTADIEAGYGYSPESVAATIRAVIAAGAVGVNLEDRQHGSSGLFDLNAQVERIRAARKAAGDLLWINARTDTFLLCLGVDEKERFLMTVELANAYLLAGADMVFVPGLVDVAVLTRLCQLVNGPISVMAMPGAPSAAALFAAGVRRVSLGVCPMLAVMGTLRDIAIEAREAGTWRVMGERFYGFAEAESLVCSAAGRT